MSFQSSSHFDSTPLLIVKNEIENTIKNVENGVTNLLEDGSLPFGIDDALINLEQCSHILNLIDQPYIARLNALIAKVMQKVISDSQNNKVNQQDVEAMSEATNVLKRYIDFLCVRETRAAQFLIPIINKLEIVLNIPLTREGIFLTPFLETIHPNIHLESPAELPASQYVIRLYKLALLHLLREQETDLDFQAFSLCGNYLSTQATGTPSQQYWRFAHIVLQNLDNMIITEPRLRVLIQLEQQAQQFLSRPQLFSVTQNDYADMLALCLSQDSDISYQIRDQLSVHEDVLSDNQLQVLSRQLYGPDLNTIQTIVQLLNEQIRDVSNKIETGQYIQNAADRETIHASLNEVCNILNVINLNDAGQQLRVQAERIRANENLAGEQHASQMMNSLLFATNSLQILERNYTPSRLKLKFNNTQITLDKVEEAQKVLCNEARITLNTLIDQLTQYSQSQDVSLLQTTPEQLREISGALLFLESEQGHQILQKAANLLEHNILANHKTLSLDQLRLLADAIASADLYFEQLQNQQPLLSQAMQVGQQSIEELSKAVA